MPSPPQPFVDPTAFTYLATQASDPTNFTLRGVLAGLIVGLVILFSNMYFGLQTGWISGMSMPASLIGFAMFRALRSCCASLPPNRVASGWFDGFSEVENVLVQTVAGAVGTMPLAGGFVGVIPGLEFLVKGDAVRQLGFVRLAIWGLGIAFFGIVFAVPLRREVLIREKLKFPSGTATALMIGVLHGDEKGVESMREAEGEGDGANIVRRRVTRTEEDEEETDENILTPVDSEEEVEKRSNWKAEINLLGMSFGISGFYVSVCESLLE
jgi:uncharacterized oligopeptide transporter (OPT) family protein